MGRVVVGGKLGERAKIRGGREDRTKVLPAIKEVVLAGFGDQGDRDPFVIHPSEMAKPDWCHRATYWRISGRPQPPGKFNFVLETIFAEGNGAHSKWQDWLRKTGKLYGSWECLACDDWWEGVSGELQACTFPDGRIHTHIWEYREVRMSPSGTRIAGRADGGYGDALVECKTVGIGTLRAEAPQLLKRYYHQDVGLYDLDRLWKELARPFPSHVRQANVYLWLAQQLGLPFTQMNFIYEFKPNQQSKEFVITLSASVIEPLLVKARQVEEALLEGVPPPCEFGGCEQCQAYEGGTGDSQPQAGKQPDRKTRRVVTQGRAGGGEAAARPPEAPRRRTTASAKRPDRAGRPRADGPVRQAQPVGRVPRGAAQHGPGRRVVRGQAGGEADRVRADQGEG